MVLLSPMSSVSAATINRNSKHRCYSATNRVSSALCTCCAVSFSACCALMASACLMSRCPFSRATSFRCLFSSSTHCTTCLASAHDEQNMGECGSLEACFTLVRRWKSLPWPVRELKLFRALLPHDRHIVRARINTPPARHSRYERLRRVVSTTGNDEDAPIIA